MFHLTWIKTKVDDIDVIKLKTFPVDLKMLSDVVDREVAVNKILNTIKTKVSNLEKKVINPTALIHFNQWKTYK